MLSAAPAGLWLALTRDVTNIMLNAVALRLQCNCEGLWLMLRMAYCGIRVEVYKLHISKGCWLKGLLHVTAFRKAPRVLSSEASMLDWMRVGASFCSLLLARCLCRGPMNAFCTWLQALQSRLEDATRRLFFHRKGYCAAFNLRWSDSWKP